MDIQRIVLLCCLYCAVWIAASFANPDSANAEDNPESSNTQTGYPEGYSGSGDSGSSSSNLEPGSSNPESGSSYPESGSSNPDPGSSDPESGSSNPESGSSNPESGSSNPESESSNPESGFPAGGGDFYHDNWKPANAFPEYIDYAIPEHAEGGADTEPETEGLSEPEFGFVEPEGEFSEPEGEFSEPEAEDRPYMDEYMKFKDGNNKVRQQKAVLMYVMVCVGTSFAVLLVVTVVLILNGNRHNGGYKVRDLQDDQVITKFQLLRTKLCACSRVNKTWKQRNGQAV